jgi:putative hemolysin
MILTKLRTQPTAKTTQPKYVARLARDAGDVRRAQRLRFEVFNLELNEGLAESHFAGLDVDPFDEVCDHLIVEDIAKGEVVGTYRLQTGGFAAANIGYYCEREFCFHPYERYRSQIIELGRACVHAEHRNFGLLHMLWRGIADYAVSRSARFLVGCSSLTSQDPIEGAAIYQQLAVKHLARPEWRTAALPVFALPAVAGGVDPGSVRDIASGPPGSTPPATVPKLIRAYLAIGAKICGPPALDREFGTIDFLTLLDLHALPLMVRAHFFGGLVLHN